MYVHCEFQRCLIWITIPVLFLIHSWSSTAFAAPVRLWGDYTTIYRHQDLARNDLTSTNWLNLATLNASSYIWHPWFALVSGSLSLSSNENNTDGNFGETNNESIGARFQLNLFPTSRFPLSFYVRKNEVTQDNILQTRTTTQTTVGLSQQYSSKDGSQSYYGQFEHRDSENIDLINTKSDTFNFLANYQLDNNSFSGDLRYEDSVQVDRSDETDQSVVLRHSYTGSSELSVENLVSTSTNEENFVTTSTEVSTDQASSFMSWRPEENPDLIITGNLRIAEQEQEFFQVAPTTSPVSSQSFINLNQGLIYNLNRNVTLRQSINLNQSRRASTDLFSGSESAGITYSPDAIRTQTGIYNWSAGTNASHSHGDSIESTNSISVQLSHSFSRDLYLRPDIQIQSNFTQSGGYSRVTDREDTGNISHSASFGWNDSSRSRRSSIRFTASDARSFDNEEAQFQLFNLQLNNDYRLNRHSQIGGDITLQKSRTSTVDSKSGTRLISGLVRYTNTRFMNWHGVRFRSELSISEQEPTNSRDIIANDDAANNTSWENDLAYRIGLFESRLSLDYIEAGSSFDRIIIIQLTRYFGDL